MEPEEELEGIKEDIIVIGEFRGRGKQFEQLTNGHHLYHIGMKDTNEAGVG